MESMLSTTGLPSQDLAFGASVYFPPFFKVFAFGFVIQLVIHRLLRGWIYTSDIWHLLLVDLPLFAICVCLTLAILIAWQLYQSKQLNISQ